MTYEEALRRIHGIPRMPKEPGLERMRRLMALLGNPQEGLRFIHVAGTNGKGSVCAMLSAVYKRAGYRTGLFLSPYVLDFRERMQVGGEMIGREELAVCARPVLEAAERLGAQGNPPSEFEVVTAIAFVYFARRDCELVVLETGIGGRLDATNVIAPPLVSVITAIGLDHTAMLGDSLEAVAGEKCGIIKEGGTAVSYPRQEPEALGVIMEHCAQKGNRLLMGTNAQVAERSLEGTRFRYEGGEYALAMPGLHQVWNAVTVLETVKAVNLSGFVASGEAVREGLRAAVLPARMEVLGGDPLVVLDGAHNPAGAQALLEGLELLGERRIHGVVGMVAGKDAAGCLARILPRCATVTVTAPSVPGATPAAELAVLARTHCADVAVEPRPEAALDMALSRCGEGEAVLVFGSLYLAAELRERAGECLLAEGRGLRPSPQGAVPAPVLLKKFEQNFK